jgi:hypothetical protein
MRLYKYCDAGGLEIIRACAIKVSSPLELNDPFDCNPIFDVQTPSSRSVLEQKILEGSVLGKALVAGKVPEGMSTDMSNELLKGLWQKVTETHVGNPIVVNSAFAQSRANLAIPCLSAEKSHHLMWSHYAKGHQGLVIEFETDLMSFAKDGTSVTDTLFKVEYSEKKPLFKFDKFTLDGFQVKGMPWAYEREWRAIYLNHQFDTRVAGGREMRLRKFKPSCIKAVYLGCCMPGSHQVEAKRLLSRDYYEGVELFQIKQ